MNLAKVLGRVVATHKEESLNGLKLLMLGVAGSDGKITGGSVVAVDAVGAGEVIAMGVRVDDSDHGTWPEVLVDQGEGSGSSL